MKRPTNPRTSDTARPPGGVIRLTDLPALDLQPLLSGAQPYNGTGFSEFDRIILQHCQDYCTGNFDASAPLLRKANLLRDDLAFGFTNAQAVNAAASSIFTSDGRYDLIWINAGMALELRLFYSAVLQDPGIFEWVVGNETRALLALVLLRWSLLFVQLHELTHVLFGHIDYLQSNLRVSMVSEADVYGDTPALRMSKPAGDPTGASESSIIWRMEAEADEFAVRAAALQILIQPSVVYPTLFSGDQERMMYAWTFAMASVFIFFDRLAGGKKGGWQRPSRSSASPISRSNRPPDRNREVGPLQTRPGVQVHLTHRTSCVGRSG